MGSDIVAPAGRVLVEEIEVEKKSAGGIILTGDSDPERKARYGEIVSNGIMKDSHKNLCFKEGLKVFFGKHAGSVVQYGDRKYISLLESELLAITK